MMGNAEGKASPYTDPTYNVLLLVEAAVKRLDDLQTSEIRRIDERTHLRFEYTEKLTVAESKRIDAIRAVDVGAVAIASERAAQQATVLANQVAASAETLRALVASTAATVAQQLAQVSNQLVERISLLEKSQYEIRGGVGTPPAWATSIIETVNRLQSGGTRGEGRSEGIAKFAGWIVSGILLLVAVIPFIVKALALTK